MSEKKSFEEIINNNLTGMWCDGICLLDVYEESFDVINIYDRPGFEVKIERYPIATKEKRFNRVIKTDFETAIKELFENGKTIKSPIIEKSFLSFERDRKVAWGGNLFDYYSEDDNLCVNDVHQHEDLDWILEYNLITKEEQEGKWLVF